MLRQHKILLASAPIVATASLPFLDWSGGDAYVTVIMPPMGAMFLLLLPVLALPLAIAASWHGRGDEWLGGYAGCLIGTLPWTGALWLRGGRPLELILSSAVFLLAPFGIVGGVRAAVGSIRRGPRVEPAQPPTEAGILDDGIDPGASDPAVTGSPSRGRGPAFVIAAVVGVALVVIAVGGAGGWLGDRQWAATASMSTVRDGHTATLLRDGRVLVVGGMAQERWDADRRVLATAEAYDARTGSWNAIASMSTARYGHTATRLADGRVLVVGGLSGAGTNARLTSAEIFDPATGAWTRTGDMRDGDPGAAVLLADGRVLALGRSCEVYDPASGTWTRCAPVPGGQSGPVVLLRDGRVLMAGGSLPRNGSDIDFDTTTKALLFDPSTGAWRQAASLLEARAGATATLLADGRVLVVGGMPYEGATAVLDPPPLRTAEIWDPKSETWAPAAGLAEGRTSHSAVLLADGRVLVAGGGNLQAEVWSPRIGAWSAAGRLATPRYSGQESVLLEDGRVLVVGGYVDHGDLVFGGTDAADVYTPPSG